MYAVANQELYVSNGGKRACPFFIARQEGRQLAQSTPPQSTPPPMKRGEERSEKQQVPEVFTGEFVNGRAWTVLGQEWQVGYIMAMRESMASSQVLMEAAHVDEKLTDALANAPVGFTADDYLHELNAFYADRANIRIPVVLAFHYCNIKLKGQVTKEQLENRLIDLRRSVSNLD